MQSSVSLKISSGLEISDQMDSSLKQLILQTIHTNEDQVGYMLQVYYPREKVSQLTVVPDSISENLQVITLKLQYVLEEFSACSAIDTLLQEKMTLTVHLDKNAGELELKGEYWPERDSDS